MPHTVVNNFWSQNQALYPFLRFLYVWVRPYGVYPCGIQGIMACDKLFSATRDVLGVEDARGGGGDGFAEETAVQHLHGAVDGRGEHVGGIC